MASTFSVSVIGTLSSTHKEYNVYNSSWSNLNDKTVFDIDTCGIEGFKINATTSTAVFLKQIDIMLDGTIVKSIEFRSQSNAGWSPYVKLQKATGVAQEMYGYLNKTYNKNVAVLVNGYAAPFGTISKTFSGSGKYHLYAMVRYTEGNANNYEITDTTDLGEIQAYNPSLYGLTLDTSNVKNTYYKNETYDPSGIIVKGNYKYVVGSKSFAYSAETTAYTITRPKFTEEGHSEIVVSYGGFKASYKVLVYGVSSFTQPVLSKVLYKHNEIVGPQVLESKSVITYDDETTEEVVVNVNSIDCSNVGKTTAKFTIFASITKETFTWEQEVEVCSLSKITIGGAYQTSFEYNEKFNYNGLILTATYGNAGNLVVEPESVEPTDWSVGKDKIVIVEYRGIEAQYLININGLSAITVDITNCALYDQETKGFRFFQNETFITTNKVVSVKRFYNGVESGWNTYTGSVEQSPIDISNAVAQTVNFTIEENGITLSASKDVIVYNFVELLVSNTPKQLFISNGTLPRLEIPNLIVQARTSDNRTASGFSYTIFPTIGSELKSGDNTIVVSAKNVSKSFVINVSENKPLPSAHIMFDGAIAKTIYLVGETLDLTGLTVKVSQMENGERDYVVPFNATIVGKTDLTFSSIDTTGYFDIIISVDGVEETKVIENAILLDGVSAVSDISLTKTLYTVGEVFDINTIVGKIQYFSGKEETITAEKISNIRTSKFTLNEAGTPVENGCGTVSISFNVLGFAKSVNVNVRRIYKAVIEQVLSKKKFDIGDKFVFEGKVQLYYNDESNTLAQTITNSYSEYLSFAFTDLNGNTISNCSKDNLVPTADRQDSRVNVIFNYIDKDNKGVIAEAPTMQISVKALRSVELLNPNGYPITKISLNKGDRFSLENNILKATFNDDTASQTTIGNSFINCNPAMGTIINGKTNASATYVFNQYDKQTVNFVVHVIYTSDIAVDFSKTATSYFAHEKLDVRNITATKKLVSTDETNSLYPQNIDITNDLVFKINSQIVGLNDFEFFEEGNYTLSATFSDFSKTMQITVYAVVLESITLSTDSSFRPLDSYAEDQTLNLKGLTATLQYNKSESNKVVEYTDANLKIVDELGNKISKSKTLTVLDNGKDLYVVYESKSALLGKLVVAEKTLNKLVINQFPNKTTFTYGDIFDTTGLIVVGEYNNGTTEIISNYEILGVDKNHTFIPSVDEFGEKTITISYNGKTTTFDISVIAPTLKSLKTNIDSGDVATTFYDGGIFNKDGLVVTAVMANGFTTVVSTYSDDSGTVLNLDIDNKIHLTGQYGSKTITITAQNPYNATETATTTYNVEIKTSGAIKSATKIFTTDDYNRYVVGEEFTAKGVAFNVVDIDGNTWVSTTFNTSIPLGTVLRSAGRIEVTCTYANGDYFTYEIIVSLANALNFTETTKHKIAIGNSNGELFTEIKHEEATIKFGNTYDENGNITGTYYPIFKADLVGVDNDEAHINTFGYNIYLGNNAEKDCIGYLDLGVDNVRNAHLILFNDPVNPIEGDGNIEVLFPHFVEGASDKINKAKFGIVYNNRLFVSGNAEYKNCDWHSSETNNGMFDFTYFSDLDYCYYGANDTAVVGYDIYRDGDLIVFKEDSRTQATIYKRNKTNIVATNYTGRSVDNGTLYEESYPMFDINANGGAGGLNNRAIVNFIGSTLFLTKNGLKELTNKGDISGNSKYCYDVSSYINPRIKYEDLKNAHMFAFQDRLFLKTNRGVYVGESSLRNENNEYEWYFLTNINADYFYEYDDELYFADTKGNISKFNSEFIEYNDKHRTYIGVGGAYLSIDEANDSIITSAEYKDQVVDGNDFHLITRYTFNGVDQNSLIHASLGSVIEKQYLENNKDIDAEQFCGVIDSERDVIIVSKNQNLFDNGKEIYLDKLVGNGHQVNVNTVYKLVKVAQNTYKLENASWFGLDTVRISSVITDQSITKITDAKDYGGSGAKQFKLLGDHDTILDLINYDNRDNKYSAVITSKKAVKAKFITAPYALNTLLNTKTIHQWVIANDTNLASYMDVGYLTNHKQGDYGMAIEQSSGSSQLNLGQLAFDKIQFTSDNLPHIYAKNKTLSNIGFIRFLFKNDMPTNMVLTTLQIVYTYSSPTKGVK